LRKEKKKERKEKRGERKEKRKILLNSLMLKLKH
jgi:hypothetical protein